MSKTYSIGCKDCKQHIWIAQGSYDLATKGHVYGYPKIFEWLVNHLKHNLVFDENCESETFDDFEEIEIDK